MKVSSFFLLMLLCSCSIAEQDQVNKIDNDVLTEILVFSEVLDLNTLQKKIEKGLWVKLYKVPDRSENDCFPESHGVCKYKYYIATSQLDDSPIINAYFLGVLGEVVDFSWEITKELDSAVINFTVNKYSKEAILYNKSLKNNVSVYKLVAKPNSARLIMK